MKAKYFVFLLFFFTSCCYEYFGPSNDGRYHIVSSTNGQDLVFGPNRIYNKDSIKFFSIDGFDTIKYQSDLSTYPGADSILLVYYSQQQKKDTIYVKLNDSDIDTLLLTWKVDDSKCSKGAFRMSPSKYNDRIIDTVNWVAYLRK